MMAAVAARQTPPAAKGLASPWSTHIGSQRPEAEAPGTAIQTQPSAAPIWTISRHYLVKSSRQVPQVRSLTTES